MSDVSGSSDDGEDYVYGGTHMQEIKRYPVHDCCEYEDAEALRVSILFFMLFRDDVSSGPICCYLFSFSKHRPVKTTFLSHFFRFTFVELLDRDFSLYHKMTHRQTMTLRMEGKKITVLRRLHRMITTRQQQHTQLQLATHLSRFRSKSSSRNPQMEKA